MMPPLSPTLDPLLNCLPRARYREILTEQIEAYGKACRDAALEKAAAACESQADQLTYPSTGNAIALVCAGKIRSLK